MQEHCLGDGAKTLPGALAYNFSEPAGSRLMAGYAQIGGSVAALALVLGGCASSGSALPDVVDPPTLRQVMRDRGLDPDEIPIPHHVNEEMRLWLEQRVERLGSSYETLQELLRELQSTGELSLFYDPAYTGTAEEVFETGRFNCLSYTHLFVGMARELGIDAYYLSVDDLETYRRDNDLVVRSGHITAAYSDGPNQRVLEFSVGPQVDYRFTRQIPDLTAIALYYSNRGAEHLRAGGLEEARWWLAVAVRLDPLLADAWTNLGVARRRLGDLEGAERAYREAIRADPSSFTGYLNLTALYKIRGEKQAATKLLRLLDRRQNRNPYIYLALGDESLEEGRLADAQRFYRKALGYSDEPAEALAALGSWALAAGELDSARDWLDRAERDDARNPRVLKLAMDLRATESG